MINYSEHCTAEQQLDYTQCRICCVSASSHHTRAQHGLECEPHKLVVQQEVRRTSLATKFWCAHSMITHSHNSTSVTPALKCCWGGRTKGTFHNSVSVYHRVMMVILLRTRQFVANTSDQEHTRLFIFLYLDGGQHNTMSQPFVSICA